jgi:hypothetical protein
MPSIATRGALSAKGYGFSASTTGAAPITSWPNTAYILVFGGRYCGIPSGSQRMKAQSVCGTRTTIVCHVGSFCIANGCGNVGGSAQNNYGFGFYYGCSSSCTTGPLTYNKYTATLKHPTSQAFTQYGNKTIFPSSSIVISTCGFGSSVYRSTDSGLTYTNITSNFTGNVVYMYAKGLCVKIGTLSGSSNPFTRNYYYSTDGGASWSTGGASGLPTTQPLPSKTPFLYGYGTYANGKHNLWMPSCTCNLTLTYYTSSCGSSWSSQGAVTGFCARIGGTTISYVNSAYYARGYGNQMYKATNGHTFTASGNAPTSSTNVSYGFTANGTGFIMNTSGYCCSGTKTCPVVYTSTNYCATSWSATYTFAFNTYGSLARIFGLNQDGPN